MRKDIILIAGVLILCFGCKTRKVALKIKDSTATTTIDKQVHSNTVRTDSAKKTTQEVVVYQDTSGYKVVITPIPGKIVNIGKDGSFSGEAANIEITGKKHINSNTTRDTQEASGSTTNKTVDSASNSKQIVTVHTKDKQVDSKPDYSWIWWVGGGLLILAGLFYLYKKFL